MSEITTIDDISLSIARELNQREYIGGDTQKNAAIQCKINELLTALHDAINRPMGVVPKSADKFYTHHYYDKKKGI